MRHRTTKHPTGKHPTEKRTEKLSRSSPSPSPSLSPSSSRSSPSSSRYSLASRNTSPPYTNAVYGTPDGIDNNNCYSYAIDYYRPEGSTKLQPGDISGTLTSPLSLRTCDKLKKRILADLKGEVYEADKGAACRPGYHEIAAVMAPGNDFHFYRRHRDVLYRVKQGDTKKSIADWAGISPNRVDAPSNVLKKDDIVLLRDARLWSHKRGLATGPLLEDSCGNPIRSPDVACRNYSKDGGAAYSKVCGHYCVKTKQR